MLASAASCCLQPRAPWRTHSPQAMPIGKPALLVASSMRGNCLRRPAHWQCGVWWRRGAASAARGGSPRHIINMGHSEPKYGQKYGQQLYSRNSGATGLIPRTYSRNSPTLVAVIGEYRKCR
jgi:hypothetical protein